MDKKNRVRKKSSQKKIEVSVAQIVPERIPSRWVKTYIAVVFLPVPALLLTQTFFSIFAREVWQGQIWRTPEFWFFAMGVALWSVIFFGLPRTIWLYVFGHELTHALCVFCSWGRVRGFHVSKEGGYILSNKINSFISLAPYFFPIYSIIFIIAYWCSVFFWPSIAEHPYATHALFGGIGFTWAFHVSFTFWMLLKEQGDIAYSGRLFSWLAIYIVNLSILAGLLIIVSPKISFWSFAVEFFNNTAHFFAALTAWIARLAN